MIIWQDGDNAKPVKLVWSLKGGKLINEISTIPQNIFVYSLNDWEELIHNKKQEINKNCVNTLTDNSNDITKCDVSPGR